MIRTISPTSAISLRESSSVSSLKCVSWMKHVGFKSSIQMRAKYKYLYFMNRYMCIEVINRREVSADKTYAKMLFQKRIGYPRRAGTRQHGRCKVRFVSCSPPDALKRVRPPNSNKLLYSPFFMERGEGIIPALQEFPEFCNLLLLGGRTRFSASGR
jgi:hypothetical protein